MDRRFAKASALVIILLGATALAVGGAAAAEEAQQARRDRAVGTGLTLAVLVRDADGEPVPAAHVTVVLIKDGQKHRIDRDDTDRRGAAVFELRSGAYEVHVQSDAGSAVETVRLHESQRLPVTVEPERPQRAERPARG